MIGAALLAIEAFCVGLVWDRAWQRFSAECEQIGWRYARLALAQRDLRERARRRKGAVI